MPQTDQSGSGRSGSDSREKWHKKRDRSRSPSSERRSRRREGDANERKLKVKGENSQSPERDRCRGSSREGSRSSSPPRRGGHKDKHKHKKKKDHKHKSHKKEKKRKRPSRCSDDNEYNSEYSNNISDSSTLDDKSRGDQLESTKLPTSDSIPSGNYVKLEDHSLKSTSFFATLKAQENAVAPVGTFHAVGRRRDDGKLVSAEGTSTDWSCHKCAATNFRHTVQCHKCKAMKRMTTWR